MPTLALPATADTSPHFDVKATDDGHPHDVLLVLGLGVVQDDHTMTVWATRRKRRTDLLIDPAGNRSRSPLPVGSSRLASRRPGVALEFPLGKWCSTSFVGSQRFFQLLPQAFVLSQCPLQLLLQRLYSPLEFFLLSIRGATVIGCLHPFDNGTSPKICPAPCLIPLCLLSCPLVNIVERHQLRRRPKRIWLP
jgi:hypothetical protein